MNRNGAQLQAAKPLGTVTNNYRPRQFRSRRTASCISAQTPPRLGYKDERGMLFFEMVKILRERKPRFFIAENVKGLLSTNKGQAYPMIMKEFSDAGYKVVHKLLNAFDYGVPQKRERVIIIGFREEEDFDKFRYPNKIKQAERKVLGDVIIVGENHNEKLFFSEKAVAVTLTNHLFESAIKFALVFKEGNGKTFDDLAKMDSFQVSTIFSR